MIRPLFLAAALFATAPALAAQGAFYSAEPAAAPSQDRFVARDAVWRCAGGVCSAPRGNARPAIACAQLVREVGALRSFSANGTAFGTAELEACNRRAR
jgi:hypothetical protein